ncbi:Thoeris anti-defense Tad2 family protein [Entomomonas asaccharolytica]|uniref:DUF2829 domain-containing protein n=1 Tax=Entomomonas asaccharolytica TaxID=2785331 RepID=A0A974NHM7_9GAMM|nr:MW1434 family type I TA system toxin [Entomomonas asaccharolytica]QQP86803.1 DUF2829 domain-containing protein [Entomomonas asaccharolytica]
MNQYDFSWALTKIKSGEKLTRVEFPELNYVVLENDENNNEYIKLVDGNGGFQPWPDTHQDLLANDWKIYDGGIIEPPPPVRENHVKGIVTIGYYFDKPSSSQHDYGYYQKFASGGFELISTDLFDPSSVEVATCCGFKNDTHEGFLFQIANEGSGQNINFLSQNRNAPLTVYIGNDQFNLGAYTGLSNYKNYYWRETEQSIALRQKYFNQDMVGKSFEILLQFDLA